MKRKILLLILAALTVLATAYLFWLRDGVEVRIETHPAGGVGSAAPRLRDAGVVDGRKADMGMRLFQNKSVGRSHHRRCAACHDLASGGTDGKEHGGLATRSVVNADRRTAYLHDSSMTDLHDVVKLMIEDPRFAHGGSIDDAAARVANGQLLGERFRRLYGSKADGEHLVEALVHFIRTLE